MARLMAALGGRRRRTHLLAPLLNEGGVQVSSDLARRKLCGRRKHANMSAARESHITDSTSGSLTESSDTNAIVSTCGRRGGFWGVGADAHIARRATDLFVELLELTVSLGRLNGQCAMPDEHLVDLPPALCKSACHAH